MRLWQQPSGPNDDLAAYDALRAEYRRYADEVRLCGGEPEHFDDWAGYGEEIIWEND